MCQVPAWHRHVVPVGWRVLLVGCRGWVAPGCSCTPMAGAAPVGWRLLRGCEHCPHPAARTLHPRPPQAGTPGSRTPLGKAALAVPCWGRRDGVHTGVGVRPHTPSTPSPACPMRMNFLFCISFPDQERSKPNAICRVILQGVGSRPPSAGLELCSGHRCPLPISIILVPPPGSSCPQAGLCRIPHGAGCPMVRGAWRAQGAPGMVQGAPAQGARRDRAQRPAARARGRSGRRRRRRLVPGLRVCLASWLPGWQAAGGEK